MRYWRSSLCEKTEPIDPSQSDYEDYRVGDSEPCLCGDLRCAATVEEDTDERNGEITKFHPTLGELRSVAQKYLVVDRSRDGKERAK